MFMGLVRTHLQYYPSPSTINTSWNIGIFLAGVLVLQIVTGIILAALYSNSVEEAFFLVHSYQRKDYIDGWLIHYTHVGGSSVLFALVYLHMALKFPRAKNINPSNWISGLITLLIWMAVGFLGYILPWGQMSYWAATVISSLFPLKVIKLFLGNYYLDSLYRILAFHYLLPLFSLVVVWFHMFYLHEKGSNTVLGYTNPVVNFYPLVLIQDLAGFTTLISIMIIFISFYSVANPTNVLEVSRFNTPIFIEPEWYFLSYYAILKSIPNIYVGEMLFVCYIIVLFNTTKERTRERLKVVSFTFLVQEYLGITIPNPVTSTIGQYMILTWVFLIKQYWYVEKRQRLQMGKGLELFRLRWVDIDVLY